MKRTCLWNVAAVAILAGAAASPARAAKVFIRNGGWLSGEIEREDADGVVLRYPYGIITLRWSDVREIRRTAVPPESGKPPAASAACAAVSVTATPDRALEEVSPRSAPDRRGGTAQDREKIRNILAGLDGSPAQSEECLKALLSAPGGVSALMGVLVGEGGAEGPRDEISMVSPEQKVELTSDRRALVHRAVARREGDFLSWVRTLPAGAEGTFLRVAAMEVAGEIPSEKSLGLLFDIASGIGGDRFPPAASGVFEGALEKILLRHSANYRRLRDLWPGLGADLAAPVIRAFLRADPAEAALFLGEVMGRDPTRDVVLLREISAAGLKASGMGDAFLGKVRGLLGHRDPPVRRAAVQALGRIADRGAAAGLILALEDEDPAVKQGAHEALVAISGMNYPPSPDRWKAWLEEIKNP